jgi:hypothetical protein
MIVSLNEVETTILKAARGAGMAWGLAEEAAQAARWLAARRLPFETLFVSLLEAEPWRADLDFAGGVLKPRVASDCLCPIRAGAFLSDIGAALPIRFEKLFLPLLLAPFAARRDECVSVQWDETLLRVDRGRLAAPLGSFTPLAAVTTVAAEVRTGGQWSEEVSLLVPEEGGVAIDSAAWTKIQNFEARLYVPASLESRLSGAGASLDDND